MLSNHFRLW